MTADPAATLSAKAPGDHRARATAVEETIELRGARSGASTVSGETYDAFARAIITSWTRRIVSCSLRGSLLTSAMRVT